MGNPTSSVRFPISRDSASERVRVPVEDVFGRDRGMDASLFSQGTDHEDGPCHGAAVEHQLHRIEACRPPSVNHRWPRRGGAGDQRLQQRADAGAGRVAVTARRDAPRLRIGRSPAPCDLQQHPRDGARPLLADEELDVARARRPETRQDPLLGERVLQPLGIVLEREPVTRGARVMRLDDQVEVTRLARAYKRTAGAPGLTRTPRSTCCIGTTEKPRRS